MADVPSGVGIIEAVGVPATAEYRLGGGDVYIASLLASGMPLNFRAIGNCPTFTITATTETYEHDSVQGTVPVQDASVPIRAASSIGFTLENLSAQNLALFFLGDTASYTNPTIAGITVQPFVLNANIVKNSWYQIYDSSGDPAFGISSTSNIVLQSGDTAETMTEDTDYVVDAVSGKVFVMDTAKVDTIIALGLADGDIDIILTADSGATTVDQVTGMTNTTIEVACHITAKNAFEDGLITDFHFHKISLTPDGDLNLITQEAGAMPFTGQIQTNAAFTNKFDVYRPVDQVIA